MNTLISLLGMPLGRVMRWCYALLGSYGPAILLFTLITKVLLLPLVLGPHLENPWKQVIVPLGR